MEHKFGDPADAPSISTGVETSEVGRIAKPAPVAVGTTPVGERSGTAPSLESLPKSIPAAAVAVEGAKRWLQSGDELPRPLPLPPAA
jgi:hypothetical protein